MFSHTRIPKYPNSIKISVFCIVKHIKCIQNAFCNLHKTIRHSFFVPHSYVLADAIISNKLYKHIYKILVFFCLLLEMPKKEINLHANRRYENLLWSKLQTFDLHRKSFKPVFCVMQGVFWPLFSKTKV